MNKIDLAAVSKNKNHMDALQLPREFHEVCEHIIESITPGYKRKFIKDLVSLFDTAIASPSLKYTTLAANGPHDEKTYRSLFMKDVDWEKLNRAAVFEEFSPADTLSVVIDPSHITKSGKETPGFGKYWSGAASQMKYGLELSAVGIIDMEREDCMMIGASQTVRPSTLGEHGLDLLRWYLLVIGSMKDTLRPITNLVTGDSFFAKEPFVDGLKEMGFSIVSRLRDDCSLRYIHDGNLCPVPEGKRGPKPRFDGKIDLNRLDKRRFRHFTVIGVEGDYYTAVVNSPALGCDIRVVIYYAPGGKPKVLFSNDLSISGETIEHLYRLRFKVEFIIRDGKQFTGLMDSQSRKARAMDFSFNLSFALLNIAKITIGKARLGISIGKFKTLVQLASLVIGITSMLGIVPNKRLILRINQQISKMAKICA